MPKQKSKIVNVATVPHRSPFRYPGGKTWLVPHIRLWLRSIRPPACELIEPFAGGAIVGLTAVFENLVERVTLVEIDDDVAAVWHTILSGNGTRLAQDIVEFELSLDNVKSLITAQHRSLYKKALATIVKNRVQHGGILAPGASLMKNGENGRGISSRWYPQTLRRRMLSIVAIRDRIRFVQGDGASYLRNNRDRGDVVYFIDPPYTVAGRRLYSHSIIDHDALFETVSTLSGDFLMTYDNVDEIHSLARKYRFDTEKIAMKNTHNSEKTELLIGRDLKWARSGHLQ